MKAFQFRLARVLRLKQQRERLAELRQLQARHALDQARAEAARQQQRLAQYAGDLAGLVGRPLDAADWLGRCLAAARLARTAEAAEEKVRQLDRQWQQAAAERARAAAEVEALLLLERQQRQEHQRLADRQQQERLEELGLRRWQAQRPGNEETTRPDGEGERT